MRVGMHEMHALQVRGFFHDNDGGSFDLVPLIELGGCPTCSVGS